ncbi:MAG TPA: gluconate 2-dehydrogenase subunit 3 family protein, partial [Pseudomonadales bacterium]|nr:gluconate 2-dehydrogenase subunit 3 family protein [Pseudomonadales bacterium]
MSYMNRRNLLQLACVAMGGSLLSSASFRVLAGDVPTRTASHPLFDSPTRSLVAELTEMIIPTTDTPGAIVAGVPDFVEMMAADWYTVTERRIFLDGLAELDTCCHQTFAAPFVQCSEEQRT